MTASVTVKAEDREDEEETPRDLRRQRPTLIRGVVGKVSNLYDVWSEALETKEMSWRELSSQVGFTRAYIQSLCEHEVIPWGAFEKICAALGLDAEGLLEDLE